MVEYNSQINIEGNKRIEIKSYLIQIENKASDWISDIEIPFDKNDKIEILEAYIIGPQGKRVRTLKKKEIVTTNDISNGSFYEDDFVKEFKLKWHEYPYRIKYSYRRTFDQFLFVSRWHPYLYSSVNTKKATLKVEVPKGYAVNIDSSIGLKYRADTLGETDVYYWEVEDINSLEREVYSPPFTELIPQVSIVPENFWYSIQGSFATWASYGNWHTLLNEGLDQLTPAEAIKVDQLIKGVKDQKEVIKILYHYMQDNTRYVNVAIDAGGMKPYPASYVCQNKYGDCKALTIYMKALLKQAGIDSFYTVIYAGKNPVKLNRDQPSQQFNHVILNVPVGADTIWLENTSQISPYNYLGTFTQDRKALLVDGDKSKLVHTKPLSFDDVLQESVYEFNLTEEGSGNLSVSQKFNGSAFEYYNHVHHDLNKRDQHELLQNNIKIDNADLLEFTFLQNNPDEPQINVDLILNFQDLIRNVGGTLVITPVAATLPGFGSPEQRKTPVRISYPVNKEDSMIYTVPFIKNFEVKIPEDIGVSSQFGTFDQSYEMEGNQIFVLRSFRLYKGDYSIEDYSELYNFFELINGHLKRSAIILNPM